MPKIVDHDARRKEIVDAMWRVVQRDGFAAVSVRSVAAEAGVSKASISHYFARQSDILVFAVEENIQSVTHELVKLDLDNCDVAVAVEALMIVIPTTPARRLEAQVWLALLSQHNRDPQSTRALTHLNVTIRVGIMVVLRALKSQGLMAPDRDILTECARLHAFVDGLSLQALTDPAVMPVQQVRRLVQWHLEDLARPLNAEVLVAEASVS